MRLAFYAPLKPPVHDTPSGDRAMGRALIHALEHIGAEVTLASTLRTRDGTGDAQVQHGLMQKASLEITRLIAQGRAAGWHAWVSYHNYYKAPDLIGPAVARGLNIPYLQVETSRARKRLQGPWATFAKAAEAAANAADVIFYLTERDAETLRRDAPEGQRLIHLHPFLDRDDLPPRSTLQGPILVAAMMRPGDKLASYQIIAETLALIPKDRWRLQIAGDGAMRAQVEALMAPFGQAITFLGALDADAMQHAFQSASLLFWPGVNEAFGLTYLEAQAAGVPVVAQDRPGVREVLAPGDYPPPDAGAPALAKRLMAFIDAPEESKAAGQRARNHVAAHHLLNAAAETLRQGLALTGVAR
ncbi:glycosyltransferase family 4 protein [Sulfitobacter sp. SK011]|uniref:glycosyltransferase family 4 protein n=1 Tax=Sulfitobacter sp. SK011 TaxID=1389004 RepID=UPI0020C81B93|nr:glycosyltransferase family 4 protein [Sulfitobacter sp. SK011]